MLQISSWYPFHFSKICFCITWSSWRIFHVSFTQKALYSVYLGVFHVEVMGARCSQITCNANEQWEKVDEQGDFNVWEDDLSSSLVIILCDDGLVFSQTDSCDIWKFCSETSSRDDKVVFYEWYFCRLYENFFFLFWYLVKVVSCNSSFFLRKLFHYVFRKNNSEVLRDTLTIYWLLEHNELVN